MGEIRRLALALLAGLLLGAAGATLAWQPWKRAWFHLGCGAPGETPQGAGGSPQPDRPPHRPGFGF